MYLLAGFFPYNNMRHRLLIGFLLVLFSPWRATAQEWIGVHHHTMAHDWTVPLHVDSLEEIDIVNGFTTLRVQLNDGFVIPFTVATTDSLDFAVALDEELERKNRYEVFQMYVFTRDAQAIKSRENYVPCYVAVNGGDSYAHRLLPASIRGRGNSTWAWYEKKPYRLKLDKKHKMLGVAKAKSWVLLANYRDVTDLMNTFVFELGHWMGLPFTNHTRYVELFVNGDYTGVYQMTEQVQQGENRVEVSDEHGILLTLDVDDGPTNNPTAQDNFWSKVFSMPTTVKYPSDELLTPERRDSIREVFGELEDAINRLDYSAAESLMDMESFVRYLIIQQLVYNVELSAPRSIFLYKDGDSKWAMGPLWDFDAGFDFDWGEMYTGHTFFTDYRETLLGSDPFKRNGSYKCPKFFTNLFGCKDFVKLYKDTWNHYADSLMEHTWGEMERYLGHLRQGPMKRDAQRWPIAGKTFDNEVTKMKTWLEKRVAYTGQLINGIPDPDDVQPDPQVESEKLCGTIDVSVTVDWNAGYSQNTTIAVDRDQVLSLLGIDESQFKPAKVTIVPLNTDGTPGPNNTNGTFGGWFNGDGNPRVWDGGHVYIEVFGDLFNWNCGVRKDTCYDNAHTVTMQYRYQIGTVLCKVNVRVHFTINNVGGWWW